MIYCVVSHTAGCMVAASLTRSWRDRKDIQVVIDMRSDNRRTQGDRRRPQGGARLQRIVERRKITYAAGRRVAERRTAAVPAEPLSLPRRARRRAASLEFLTPLELPREYLEDVADARSAIAVQSGDLPALRSLFDAYFGKVHTFALASLRDRPAAAEASQRVFARAHELIGSFDPDVQPFRAWLFRIACEGLDTLGHEVDDGREDALRRDERRRVAGAALDLAALRWLSDGELQVLVDSLPRDERNAVLLRFMVGLTPHHVAELLACTVAEQAELVADGLRMLASTLDSLSSPPDYMRREHMCRLPSPGIVVRRRRMALNG